MNLVERCKAPTPRFFKVLRTIGIGLTTVGTTLLAMPAGSLPAIANLGGYLIVAGTVLTTVSQLAVDDRKMSEAERERCGEKGGKP